jgi:TolB-like protein/Flp pilus assembly protein TadD
VVDDVVSLPQRAAALLSDTRLDSWKEIAAYLHYSERTVRRWEKEGLPVHRHPHKKKAAIYAYKSELDIWWKSGHSRLEAQAQVDSASHSQLLFWLGIAATMALLLATGIYFVRGRTASRVPAPAGRVLLAVLPFENLSGDPQQEYLSDGFTDEVATQLSKVRPDALGVIARTTALRYKGTSKPAGEIGRELGVGYLIEGGVLRSDGRVRVTATLIRAADQASLWAEEYNDDFRDLLPLQARISEAVVRQIGLRLTPPQEASLRVARHIEPEAHESYLRGLYELRKTSPDHAFKAMEFFQQAIARDPSDALAYAGLSEAYFNQGPSHAPLEVMPKAKAAAAKAIELDDSLAEAHTSLAFIKLYFDWDWPGAEREFRRALQLNPDLPRAHFGYAHYLLTLGRGEDALQETQRAQALDPPFPGAHLDSHINFPGLLLQLRRYAEAAEVARQRSDFTALALALAKLGKREEAIAAVDRVADSTRTPIQLAELATACAWAGRKDKAQKLLNAALQAGRTQYTCGTNMAFAYAALGDKEKALAWLGKAFRDRSD